MNIQNWVRNWFGTMVILAITGIIGYVANVIQIISAMSDPVTGMFVFKIVGCIIPPLGAILGIIGLF